MRTGSPRADNPVFVGRFSCNPRRSVSRRRHLRGAAGARPLAVAIGLQALDETRAAHAVALPLRGGLAAADAARRDLLCLDALAYEIVAHDLRAALRELLVVIRRPDA